MGKKKKRKPSKPAAGSTQKKQTPPKKSRTPLFLLVFGAALLLTGGIYLFQGQKAERRISPAGTLKVENISLRETRPTLPPESFQGKTRRAYEVAREIPEVLDGLYCYCRCRENFGHKNLLSCYVDTHAST